MPRENKKKNLLRAFILASIFIFVMVIYLFVLFPTSQITFRDYENVQGNELHPALLGNTLKYYYLNREVDTLAELKLVDSTGIPLTDCSGRDDFVFQDNPEKICYSPTGIMGRALRAYDLYLDAEDSKYLDIFWPTIAWLENQKVTIKDFVVWTHEYSYRKYSTPFDWQSAMVQGLALSCLSRAYQLSLDSTYFFLAFDAMRAYEYDLSDGGVRYEDKNEYIWFEEYPGPVGHSSIGSPPHVINGFIYSLFGLYEFYRITEEP